MAETAIAQLWWSIHIAANHANLLPGPTPVLTIIVFQADIQLTVVNRMGLTKIQHFGFRKKTGLSSVPDLGKIPTGFLFPGHTLTHTWKLTVCVVFGMTDPLQLPYLVIEFVHLSFHLNILLFILTY